MRYLLMLFVLTIIGMSFAAPKYVTVTGAAPYQGNYSVNQ
jgi:hypothetical protein